MSRRGVMVRWGLAEGCRPELRVQFRMADVFVDGAGTRGGHAELGMGARGTGCARSDCEIGGDAAT